MHAGTTSDEFLRQNLEWLSRATNWTKFSATAALGVIHKVRLGKGQGKSRPFSDYSSLLYVSSRVN
jgi:26S proteasome regulatory subunit N2